MTKSIVFTAMLLLTAGVFAQNIKEMKSIDNKAPVKCSKTITIRSDSKTVWEVLTGINNWPEWQPDISASKLNGELKQESTFEWKSGGVKIRSTLHTVNTYREFGWTGKSIGVFAVHNWILTEEEGITTLYVEESMSGFLAGLFKKPFNKTLEKGMSKWLDYLKDESEKTTFSFKD